MSKAMLVMDERDNQHPNQIRVPVPLTTGNYCDNSSDSESSSHKRVGKLDSMMGLLAAKVQKRAHSEDDSTSLERAPTGSNKRKPKSVHRVPQAEVEPEPDSKSKMKPEPDSKMGLFSDPSVQDCQIPSTLDEADDSGESESKNESEKPPVIEDSNSLDDTAG